MTSDDSFVGVMERLRAGQPAAAAEVHRRFVRRLVALAAGRLPVELRGMADPESAVQSAFGSFFRRYVAGQYDFGDWDAVWSLLAVVTLRKCGRRRSYWRADRRDARRLVPAADHDADRPVDRAPTPAEAAMLAEVVADWLDEADALDREVLELGLAGHADAEIAARLGRSERTVRRVRLRAERRLADRLELGEALRA